MPNRIIWMQFLLYLVVGGLSSCVDVGGFWLLVTMSVPLLAASVMSFIAATMLNYILSYQVAFVRGLHTPSSELVRFWLVSLFGLAMNTLIVWLVVGVLGATPVAGKLIALPIVLGWNFIGRRLFVFHRDLPPPALAHLAKLPKPVIHQSERDELGSL